MKLPFRLPTGREFDVVGFGTNAIDHLITVRQFPEFGGKAAFETHTLEPGGEVASTVVGLQRLGFKTGYAGRCGNDEAGWIGIESLRSEGVDVRWAETVDGAETQSAYIIIDGSTGERTILWRRDPRLSYKAGEADLEIAMSGRILHLTAHDTDAAIELASAAREAGTVVSLDVDNTFDRLEKLLPLVDICICSEEFGQKMFGITEAGGVLETLQTTFGHPVGVVTLGVNGSLARCNGEFVRTDAFEVPGACVDTTGAGDAFRAGFLYGVLRNATLEECLGYANAAAALKCRRPGARRGLPAVGELEEILAPRGL